MADDKKNQVAEARGEAARRSSAAEAPARLRSKPEKARRGQAGAKADRQGAKPAKAEGYTPRLEARL
jgi:hypothetical protein